MNMTCPAPVVNTGHPHGIHCCHLRGNDHNRWCAPCGRIFDQFVAATFDDDGISPHEAYGKFKIAADMHLVTTVLGQIESCVLPCPEPYVDILLSAPAQWVEDDADRQLVPCLAIGA